ncbi:MAG: alcohol dehydrogenase catalytic domain-containing protein [Gemmatimonadota bacterium]|nr:alcohol dehydrogenase catalytic domain-containing protein [Gemmatimonadota bacterium]
MKAITFQDLETLAYEDVREPEIVEPSDALVRVRVAGICGSDLHPYFGRERGLDRGTVMGHEFVGEVVEVGDAVSAVRVGDVVACPFTTSCGACFYCGIGLTARCPRGQFFGWVEDGKGLHGGQAELVRVPLADGSLVPVPEGLDEAVALLSGDILSTALYGADLAGVGAGELVVVVGCGPVGLLAIRAALGAGAREVVAVDRVATRLEAARRFGATAVDFSREDVGEVVRAKSEGRGGDRAIEAVGTPDATRTAAELLRPGGSIGAVGFHVEPHLALSPGEIYDRNLAYAGGRCSARSYMPRALELAQREAELVGSLISHRLPLSEGVGAYRSFADRLPGWNKVVLMPDAP